MDLCQALNANLKGLFLLNNRLVQKCKKSSYNRTDAILPVLYLFLCCKN